MPALGAAAIQYLRQVLKPENDENTVRRLTSISNVTKARLVP
jgi:hypothetical protein